MADFPGIAQTYRVSDKREGFFPINTRTEIRSGITNEKPYAGSASLMVKPGGMHDVYYGADSGAKELSVMCWPPVGGKCCLQIMTRGRNVLAEAWSASSGAWEKLAINYTFTKGIYIIRVGNPTKSDGDTRAWFDNLV